MAFPRERRQGEEREADWVLSRYMFRIWWREAGSGGWEETYSEADQDILEAQSGCL